MVGAGAEGSMDAGNMLKPALARELHCIGATTLDEFRSIEKDPALERRFRSVDYSHLRMRLLLFFVGSKKNMKYIMVYQYPTHRLLLQQDYLLNTSQTEISQIKRLI